MQRADFPFEVIVSEHSSSDRTRGIALAYQEMFPDKIRLVTTDRDAKLVENNMRGEQASRGKYQAVCEGDDYWIDPRKLQKQVDFLESHPDVVACFTNAITIKEDISGARLYFSAAIKPILTFEDAYQMSIPTASVVVRSSVLATLPAWRVKIWNGDHLILLWCLHQGNLGYLNEVTAVYRKHGKSLDDAMRPLRKERYENAVYLYTEFDKATQYQHSEQMQKLLKRAEENYRQERLKGLFYLLQPKRWPQGWLIGLKRFYFGVIKNRFQLDSIEKDR